MRYFDHDTHAADDDAIMALRLEHGGAAVDCYWTLLEMMYRDEKPIELFDKPTENQGGNQVGTKAVTKSVSHRLCIGSDTLFLYVSTMLELELLDGTVENLYSARAMRNIEAYRAKQETARQNGKKGGRKPSRKPKANQGGSKAETKKEPRPLQEKKRKYIGSYKEEPIYICASDGAATVETVPPSAQCLMCGSELVRTGFSDDEFWWCDNCTEHFARNKYENREDAKNGNRA